MNYIVTAGKNNPFPPNKFKTAKLAYQFVQNQRASWECSGMKVPEYHVYYQGFECVEVNENGEPLS